jgi:serine/threonine protein phosphatase PrpC
VSGPLTPPPASEAPTSEAPTSEAPVSEAEPGARACPVCGEVASPGARFCEACGADLPDAPAAADLAGVPGPTDSLAAALAAEPPSGPPAGAPTERAARCRECGGEIDADGYCTTCGAKAPSPRDHVVAQPRPWVAGVSDRGVRHHRNEDAMAIAADAAPGSRAVLVVCDGVSTSQDSDVASLAAAQAALAVLVGSHAQGLGTPDARVAAIGARLKAAADAAATAVAGATSPAHAASPPSCTFVATVLEGGVAVAGVVGDSRAYWLPDAAEAELLTTDDSWAAEQIAAGVPREEAESASHAITRWLGVDAPDHTPRVTSTIVDGPGWLLVCSDGLWNYCSPASDLAELVLATAGSVGGEPLATAAALVDWANSQGGRDNITVALARLDGR